jgi:hypothetical protein
MRSSSSWSALGTPAAAGFPHDLVDHQATLAIATSTRAAAPPLARHERHSNCLIPHPKVEPRFAILAKAEEDELELMNTDTHENSGFWCRNSASFLTLIALYTKKKQSVVRDYDHPCTMRATTFDLIVSSHDKEGACMMSSVTQ